MENNFNKKGKYILEKMIKRMRMFNTQERYIKYLSNIDKEVEKSAL